MQRVDVELAGRGDEADLELAGAAALADDEVAQEAPLGAAVPGGQAVLAADGQDLLAQRVAALGGELAVGQRRRSRSKRPGAWKPHTSSPSAPVAERVLELVAVAPLLDGGDDRLELEALEPADAASARRRPARA